MKKNIWLLFVLVFLLTLLPIVASAANLPSYPCTNLKASFSGSGSGTADTETVSITINGAKLSDKDGTLTLTNEGSSAAQLSFAYEVAGTYSSFTIAGATITAKTGFYNAEIAAGASINIYVKVPSSGFFSSAKSASVTLTDVKLEVASASKLTVSHNASGTVSVGGTTTASGSTLDVQASGTTLVATPGTNATFLAWVNVANNSVYSTSASISYVPTGDASLKAIFAHANNEACFWGSSKRYLFEGLSAAITHASSASDKTIVLAGNGKLSSGDYTIPSGVTLLLPFDSNSTCYTTSPGYVEDSWAKPSAFCTMTMVDGAKIVVAGGGAISVSAKVSAKMGYAGAPTSKYGHIAMQSGSSITVNSKGNLYAWGFISGDGNVTVKSGATVYESFQVVDWRGGTASSGMLGNNNKVFLMSQYYVQNVEVPMTLEAGSALTCSMIADVISVRVVAVQFLGSSGCIFNLTEGSAVKRYDGSTDRLILEINGKLSISPSEIELVPYLYSIDLADYVLPINNNVTLNVNSGATLTIAQDTSLLPGAQVNIAEGGNVTIASGKRLFVYDEDEWKNEYYVYSSVYFRPVCYAHGQTYTRTAKTDIIDAQVLVNGTLNASEGYLYTTKSGANICSTANGVINLRAAESSPTLYEATQSGTSISYSSISITAAQLKHGDSTYLSTVAGNYYYHPVHKKWVKDGHSFSSAVTKPTCTEKGYTTYTCTCGYSYKGDEVATTAHTEVDVPAVAPTCIETGLTAGKKCSVCGTVTVAQTTVAATGHSYGDWNTVTAATCTATGADRRDCANCDHYETRSVDALGHTEVIDAAKDATCTETGLTEGKHCGRCEEVFVVQTILPALGHTEVTDAAVAPTCIETGLTEGCHCSVCNEILAAQEVIDALGHTEVTDDAVAPTCTETGLTEGCHCSVCNEVLIAQEVIDALGHKEVIDAAVAATCIENGLTEGCHCSVCNAVIKAQTEIPATGYHYWEVYSKNENDHTCQCKNCTDTVTLHVAYRLDDYLWFNGYVADGRFTGTNVISIQSSSGVKTAVSNGTRYFVKEIPADEIPNQLKFKVVSAKNGEVTFTVSLEDYVVDSDVSALKSALLSYGEAAQKYFTGVTDVTAPTKPSFLNDHNTQVNEQQTLGNLSITTSGANIYFDEAIRLSVKYTLTAGENVVIDEKNKTVTINGVSYNVVQVGVLLNEMGFADDNLTWKWDEVALTTANSMACLTFNTKTITAPENYLPNQPDVPADPNNTNLNLPGDTVVNAFTASGEATFNLTAEQYLKGFSLRTFAVLEERDNEGKGTGVYHCIYGKQYGYGLEAYIKAMYGKADDAGNTYSAFDNLLYWTWNLAQVANGKNPLASGGNS